MGRTIAVTGVGGYLGSRVAALLADDDSVETVVGIDIAAPPQGIGKLEFHEADIRDPDLAKFLTGADTVVHLAFVVDPMLDEAEMADINLGGMRNVLDAVAASGAGRFVYTSSASAYGAHPDNPVPLREEDALRANAEFNYAEHKMESERILRDWRQDHPGVAVTVLRPAIIFGPHVSNFISRALEAPRLPLIEGCSPPLQVVHEDDAAAALAHVVLNEIDGTFNVCADDSVSQDELAEMSGRKSVRIPPDTAVKLMRLMWRIGQAQAPAGQVAYFMHPWVMANDKLRATGWAPLHTSRETLQATFDANRDYVTLGRTRHTRAEWRRVATTAAAAGAAAGAALVAVGAIIGGSRRR